MADEIDPLLTLATSHLKRMQEIADEGFEKSKELASDAIVKLKRHVGIREAVMENTLKALGIVEKPPE
jgi:hypothetical protein